MQSFSSLKPNSSRYVPNSWHHEVSPWWLAQPPCLLLKLVEFVAAFNPTNWNHPWKRHAKLDLSPNYQLQEVLKPILHGEFHVWWWNHLQVPDSSVSSRILLAPLVSSFSDILSGTEYQELPWLPCDFGGEKTCWLQKNWRVYGLLQIWKRTGPKLWLSWTVELFFILVQLQIHKHHD